MKNIDLYVTALFGLVGCAWIVRVDDGEGEFADVLSSCLPQWARCLYASLCLSAWLSDEALGLTMFFFPSRRSSSWFYCGELPGYGGVSWWVFPFWFSTLHSTWDRTTLYSMILLCVRKLAENSTNTSVHSQASAQTGIFSEYLTKLILTVPHGCFIFWTAERSKSKFWSRYHER